MGRERKDKKPARRAAPREARPRSRWAAWLLAAFLICWAFILGVLVGQGSLASPEQVAWVKHLLGLERFLGPEATTPPPQPLKTPELDFYTRVKKQRQAPASAPAKTAAPAAKPEAKPEAKPVAKPEAKPEVKSAAAPAPQAPAKAEPAPSKAPERAGRFVVQVASFSDMNQALNLVRRLQDNGYRAYLIPVNVQGAGRRFRVRVGPYGSLDTAQGAASRIRLQHKLAAYVTRRD